MPLWLERQRPVAGSPRCAPVVGMLWPRYESYRVPWVGPPALPRESRLGVRGAEP